MANRVAFFASKEDIEKLFSLDTENEEFFEAHYNITPGQQLPVVVMGNEKDLFEINQVRWGGSANSKAEKTTLHSSEIKAALDDKKLQRCVLPLSGFYVWKDDKQKEQPFFVRMLDSSIMSVAGVIESDDNGEFVRIVTMESNPLIQPMSENMPLLLDRVTAIQWLQPDSDPKHVLESAKNLYLLTDLSVLRVSKKVNDPSNNDPKLIQPIPK